MRLRILVVEDNEVLRLPLQRTLQTSGYEVLAVGTGEEALTSLAATDVHLVVTDRGLPGIDGGELIRRIRLERPALPIVMMTGHADSGLPAEIERLRVAGALLKPFEPDQLLAVIEQALAHRMATWSAAERSRVGAGVVAWETHSTKGGSDAG
jgi:two-component system C4-dicarboxylate transport response regulator DctD